MKELLSKIFDFLKIHQDDIILTIGVILICSLSFIAGFLTAKNQEKKEQIEFEYRTKYEMKYETKYETKYEKYEQDSSTYCFISRRQSTLG